MGARAGVMERVATVATAVSLAVIVVTLSVVIGFRHELASMISGASSDVVITSPQSGGMVSDVELERGETLEALLDDRAIARYSPYRARQGVLWSKENILGVLLKGIDSLYDTHLFRDHLCEGAMPRLGGEPRSKDMLCSEYMARSMDIGVGDKVEMVFVDGSGNVLRDRFLLSGIYRTGVDVIDQSIVLTDIRNIARLYDGNQQMITGYELWIEDGYDAEMVALELNERLTDLYFDEDIDAEAFTLQRLFPDIFGWFEMMDVNAVVVVVIMIIVALLNMVTSLLIIVLERQRMIGELRAIGLRRRGVVAIFFFRALFIVMRGVAWGSIAGVALCAIQHFWRVVPLPAEGYMLSSVPAAMCWAWWLVAVVGVVATTMTFLTLPAMFAARISPSETMKYE
ncbi:MAG: ABC transporter permease [Alistipes sp.]|nr:ABC transporter permease [Alistipes sp.]